MHFESNDKMWRDWINGLMSLSTGGAAKEGRPKINPRPGRGLNPGPPCRQERGLKTQEENSEK